MGELTEIDVLWITAGPRLRRRHHRHDGGHAAEPRRSVARRAAVDPEDHTSTIHFWRTKTATSSGSAFIRRRREAGAVHSGGRRIDSRRNNKSEGYWASFGTDQETGQPILTCDWIDRLAPQAWAVIAARNLRDLRRNSRHGGKSDGLHGTRRLPGMGMEIESRHSDRLRSRMSGAARQLHGDAAVPAAIWRPDARR